MGSASSKAARGAPRKYPTTPSSAAISRAPETRAQLEPKSQLQSRPSGDASKDPDAVSGDFHQRLQSIVQPNSTYSPFSTAASHQIHTGLDGPVLPSAPTFAPAKSNPTLTVLEARRRLQQAAETEFEAMGRASSKGRRFVDMRTLIDAMRLRDSGVSQSDIERQLRLDSALLDKLGRLGVLSHASTPK